MSISFAKAVVFDLAAPMVLDVIEDIIKSGTIGDACSKIKTDVINSIMDITKKTHFSWDDELAQVILDHLEKSEAADKLAICMMDCVEKWVEESETKWDDKIVLPVIVAFREVVDVEVRI